MMQTPEWHREILKSRSESPAAWLDWEETKTSHRQFADDVNKGSHRSNAEKQCRSTSMP